MFVQEEKNSQLLQILSKDEPNNSSFNYRYAIKETQITSFAFTPQQLQEFLQNTYIFTSHDKCEMNRFASSNKSDSIAAISTFAFSMTYWQITKVGNEENVILVYLPVLRTEILRHLLSAGFKSISIASKLLLVVLGVLLLLAFNLHEKQENIYLDVNVDNWETKYYNWFYEFLLFVAYVFTVSLVLLYKEQRNGRIQQMYRAFLQKKLSQQQDPSCIMRIY